MNSDPLFVSTATPDFHLQSTSLAINAGTNVGLTSDYEGNSIVGLPDIGAYEYQPPATPTPTPTSTPIPTSTTSTTTLTSTSASAPVCSDQAVGVKPPWIYGAIAQDSSSALLYFTEADNPVSKYVLEYGIKSGEYPFGVQDMGVNSRGQMTFLVKSLSPSTTYYFRVRGGNGCATGSWSNEISAKTKGLFSFNQLDFTALELITQSSTEIPLQTSCQTYTVQAGDSLWSIAQDFLNDGGKFKEIVEQNMEFYPTLTGSNNVDPGWELKLNCSGGNQPTNEDAGVEKLVSGDYMVKVKVLDVEKKPIKGAKVTIHSKVQEAITDIDGIAQFANVERGDHKVLITYKNFEGEQSLNLTGDVKEFALNVTVLQKPFSLSPLAYGIIAIMGLAIIVLTLSLIKSKNK
jgi:LysM repeat protein